MLRNTKQIIETLENAIQVAEQGNMELARVMVVASKHAIQALTFEVFKERLSRNALPTLPQNTAN